MSSDRDAWLIYTSPIPGSASLGSTEYAYKVLLMLMEAAHTLQFEWRVLDIPEPGTVEVCYHDPRAPVAPIDGIRYCASDQVQRVFLPLQPSSPLFSVTGPQIELEIIKSTNGFAAPRKTNGMLLPSPDTHARRTRTRYRMSRGPYPQLQLVWWGEMAEGPLATGSWTKEPVRAWPLPVPPRGLYAPYAKTAAAPLPQASLSRPQAPQKQQSVSSFTPQQQPNNAYGMQPARTAPAAQLQQAPKAGQWGPASYQQQLLQQQQQQQQQRAKAGSMPVRQMTQPGPSTAAARSLPAPPHVEEYDQVADALDQAPLRSWVATRYKAHHIDIAPIFDQWPIKDILLEYSKTAEGPSQAPDLEAEKARLRDQLAQLKSDVAEIEGKRKSMKVTKA